MKKSGRQLDKEIAVALHARSTSAKTKKSPFEIKTRRLKALQGAMEDAEGEGAWRDTDLADLEGRLDVDNDLSDAVWLRTAMQQLQDQSVLPEHAGAPPPNVYAWNDAFISTYRMNIDQGMAQEDAVDSARQNAFDAVTLTRNERDLIKTDPKLYK